MSMESEQRRLDRERDRLAQEQLHREDSEAAARASMSSEGTDVDAEVHRIRRLVKLRIQQLANDFPDAAKSLSRYRSHITHAGGCYYDPKAGELSNGVAFDFDGVAEPALSMGVSYRAGNPRVIAILSWITFSGSDRDRHPHYREKRYGFGELDQVAVDRWLNMAWKLQRSPPDGAGCGWRVFAIAVIAALAWWLDKIRHW